jgi:putative ABC transport system permease protein
VSFGLTRAAGGGRVPLARRNLLADPRRLAAAMVAVGLAVMLVLLLDGLWGGIKSQVTLYHDNVGADLYVAQPGTRNFLGAVSLVPMDTVGVLQADPAVRWAAPVRGWYSILELHERKVPVLIVGSVPGARGGPWELRSGRVPRGDDEVVVGDVLARQHGVSLGDELVVMGERFRVVGTSVDGFMTSFVFMSHRASDGLLRAPGTTSFVLVGTDDPAGVRTRLADSGLAVLDRAVLAANDEALMARAFGVPLRAMVAVAFAVGSLVIALTAYTAIADHRREYGIVKAIGARRRDLVRLALTQTMLLAAGGVAAGLVLFVGGRELVEWVRPQFIVLATPAGVGRAVAAAALMGLLAAVVPARRLARLDPATAYRGG